MSASQIQLPVPVLTDPHWRVNFRPNDYQEELVPTVKNCFEIIEKYKLRLRGWDYPHLSYRDTERAVGGNWVASWSDFQGHKEYWRFYQSGQFLHLFSVRESTDSEWKQKLQIEMENHLDSRDVDLKQVPGFISTLNFIYSMTEIFEFAARLCQAEVYKGSLDIDIKIKGIHGFVLAAGRDRLWHRYYAATGNELGKCWTFETDVLVAESADKALSTIVWFFERFGWLSPSEEVIRQDQKNFLSGRI
jgi:hypothetical protein